MFDVLGKLGTELECGVLLVCCGRGFDNDFLVKGVGDRRLFL